ncbi:uncharacterized protein [Nicotiana sylvestris]|uniref:Uncharacterized protein LOC104249181 n=1 Tax=Nicotiana sylvestris TaxID=4096 RepID=A0A1U7YXG4_NICSY|nr:PREDICTED: uncharacterized protein LOC104249181 [Nicotiana sylvestris]XP_009803860.1 PREDICTED: uncharacterized protein LOC104249181 [Nicotiana sylvestris]
MASNDTKCFPCREFLGYGDCEGSYLQTYFNQSNMDVLSRIVTFVGGSLNFQLRFLRLRTDDDRKRFIEFRFKEMAVWEKDKVGGCGARIASLESQITELKASATTRDITIASLIANPFLGQNEHMTFWVE